MSTFCTLGKMIIKKLVFLSYLSLVFIYPNLHGQVLIDTELSDFEGEKDCLICAESSSMPIWSHDLGKDEKGWNSFLYLKNQHRQLLPAKKQCQDFAKITKSLWVVNCLSARLTQQEVMVLSSTDGVKRILLDRDIMKTEIKEPVEVFRSPEYTWGIEMIGADIVQEMGYRGQGVTVGGQDTGVKQELSSIKKAYRGGENPASDDHHYNWFDAIDEISPLNEDTIVMPSNNPCGLKSIVPCDDDDHGSHTIGTMVGQEGDDVIGVAPEAEWIACRCMERGWGKLSTYLTCFQFFLAPTDLDGANPDPSLAPHVINNSWTCPEKEGCDPSNYSLLDEAVLNLRNAGIVVVASAGNDGRQGCSSLRYPAAIYASSFTVGATGMNDSIAAFSSRGPVTSDGSGRIKPDISAPGVQVRSQVRSGEYKSWNGTSMAGPHVAGVVALMISANPQLAGKVDVIEGIIEKTALPKWRDDFDCDTIVGQVPNNIYGYGRINALSAVEEAMKYVSTNTVDVEKSHFHIRNPSLGPLEVENSNSTVITKLTISSLEGKPVKTVSNLLLRKGFTQLPDYNLAAGTYIITITQQDQSSWVGKWIHQ